MLAATLPQACWQRHAQCSVKQRCELEAAESSIDISCCSLQAAHISAELERYLPAVEAFEAAAKAAVDNNLLKYSAKGYLLNAGICQLCSECSRALRARICKSGGSFRSASPLLELSGASASLLHSSLHCVPAPILTPTESAHLTSGCCVCLLKQTEDSPGDMRGAPQCHEGQLPSLSPRLLQLARWNTSAAPAVNVLGCLLNLCLLHFCSWQDRAHFQHGGAV